MSEPMPDGEASDTGGRSLAEHGSQAAAAGLQTREHVADIVLLGRVGSRDVYSYRVPDRLGSRMGPGHLVQVPFGPRMLQGIVLSTERLDPGSIRLRDIADILDPLPCLTEAQLRLARWMAEYYVCSLSSAVTVMLPDGLDRASETLYGPIQPPAHPVRLTPAQRAFLLTMQEIGACTARRLAGELSLQDTVKQLQTLVRRGLVSRAARLGRPAVSEVAELHVELRPAATAERLSGSQRAVLDYVAAAGGQVLFDDLRDEMGVDRAAIARLEKRGIVVMTQRPARRDPLAHRTITPSSPLMLTCEQRAVFQPIEESLTKRDGAIFLLHGITGSGKTEVYLQAVASTLASGRQAIVLVPEIGLTPQAVARFAGRFPGQVALIHSRLTSGQRFDEWQRVRHGECAVAVGPRSAIFSPFGRLGLIVLDEEHDASYKQDSTPRYHTRDVAEQLARRTGATVVLGSATPDVCSFYDAERGRFRLLSLVSRVATQHVDVTGRNLSVAAHGSSVTPGEKHRHPHAAHAITGLPSVQVVDMRLELKAGNRSMFSRALTRALEVTLSRHEQAILFLNRRGNATFINCRDCGHVVKCHRCDIPMTYHSQGERLLCHRCNARGMLPNICGACGSWRIRYFGLGTQKVEQEVRRRFPGARVQRYDRDVTSGRLGHETILDSFAAGEIDVLIGTQIVAKGLDFPRVTLVGAVAADTSLNLPDFRAAERTFSLLTQVSGRAGRAELPGTVVVQTYTPGHFAIVAAADHDYLAFYRAEVRYRKESLYPPFSRLVRLVKSGSSDAACYDDAHALVGQLQHWLESHAPRQAAIEIIGPAPCFVAKSHDRFFWQILLRGGDIHPMLPQVPRGWAVDVDPMNLL